MDDEMARTLWLTGVILLVGVVGNVVWAVACGRRRRRERAERARDFMAGLNVAGAREVPGD